MSKPKRSLAGSFDDVGGKKEEEAKNDININNDSVMNKIVKKKREKKDTHTFRGFYLENEVQEAFDTYTRESQKGVKSEIVNELIKRFLKDEGRL